MRVVVAGVVWIGFRVEAAVDDCGWRVDVYLSRLGASWCHRALSCLGAHVSDWAVQGWVDEFGVVFSHHLSLDQSSVFGLL